MNDKPCERTGRGRRRTAAARAATACCIGVALGASSCAAPGDAATATLGGRSAAQAAPSDAALASPPATTRGPSATATRPTQATVTIYGADVDSPGALVPLVATAHGTADGERVEFSIATAAADGTTIPGTCEGPQWRHPTGLSQQCWVTLPAQAGAATAVASARLTSSAGVATTAPGKYAMTARGPVAHAVAPEQRDQIARCGNTTDRVWFTFDDGFASAAAMRAVLDALAAANVRGRFFGLGEWARANPQLVAEIRRQGHLVENHSATHAWLNRLDADALRSEIAGGPAGDEPRLLRPPYGAAAFTDRVRDEAAAQGYGVCFWTVDPRDWAGPDAALITARVRDGDEKTPPVAAGGVVLLHMTGEHTAEALPSVIAAVRAKGLEPESLR